MRVGYRHRESSNAIASTVHVLFYHRSERCGSRLMSIVSEDLRKSTIKNKGGQEIRGSPSASRNLVADRQLQLFQPFHLWHTLPGFSFVAFINRLQKAASLTRASLLTVFFTCLTSSSPAGRSHDAPAFAKALYTPYLAAWESQGKRSREFSGKPG
jgi:hypothetical protein